jgi:uncharacterized membrane protein
VVHISNALIILILWINLTGLALLLRKYTESWSLARVASPIAFVIALFFIEHLSGLGQLTWVFPFTTLASCYLIVQAKDFLRKHWRLEALFYGSFLYALAWRYAFPDITASSEKITDLTFVANYFGGGRLPPVDRWLPPFPFEMYYALQQYAAALIGRVLGTTPGMAYNLGFCTIVALTATAAGATAMLLVQRRRPALLLTAAFLIGGAGTAPLIHLIEDHPALYSGVRFIGSSFSADSATKPLGRWLLNVSHVNANTPDLPVETFSYLVGLGDFHPPFSGFLLLMLALLAIAHIEAEITSRAAYVVLGACVPLIIPCNTWQFPLQVALAGGYLSLRLYSKKPVDWKAFALGLAGALFLIEPFLARFGPSAVDAGMAIRLVPADQRTPLSLWLLLFYPILALFVLHLLCGKRSRLTIGLCVLWIALLVLSNYFFIDDLYSGKYERFNTVLKSWAWIYSGGMLMIGAFNLRSTSRVCRWGTAAVLLLVCSFGGDLAFQFLRTPKPHLGQLDGAGPIRDDAGEKVILDTLQHAPPSIVLQRVPIGSYTTQPSLVIFAGQTAFLGWPDHENVWRGNRVDINARQREINTFYGGNMPEAWRWLQVNGIHYVIWGREDNQLPAGTFDRVNDSIKEAYVWRGYYEVGAYHVGLWQIRQ